MAATKAALAVLGRSRQEEVREKIKTTLLINKLQNHIDGKLELSPTQISAAKILLDKALCNAPQIVETKTEHSGTVNHNIALVPELSADEWMAAHGLGATARATE